MQRVRCIIFDLDGTLLDHETAENSALGALYRETKRIAGRVSLGEFIAVWREQSEKHYLRYLAGEISFVQQRTERVKSVLNGFGRAASTAEADALFGLYLQAYEASWRLYPDVLPCLDALAQYTLGVITNGDSQQQRLKLSRTGINNRFSGIVASGDLGISKPAKHIFVHALTVLGHLPEESVFVGDSFDHDVIGAQGAGLHAVWLDRADTGGEARGHHRIRLLTDLPPLVDQLVLSPGDS